MCACVCVQGRGGVCVCVRERVRGHETVITNSILHPKKDLAVLTCLLYAAVMERT